MKSNNDTDLKQKLETKYNSALQIHALLADTQHLVGEIGRGAGKTTEILAPRIVRVTYDLAGALCLFVGATYTFILETILPGFLSYMENNYTRGVHYEYGKAPPSHFKKPHVNVGKWEHTISFAWGTVIQFVSVDRPESAIGKNAAHIFVDEMLRIPESKFIERIMPTLRGDITLYGDSPYFKGITAFSSTPNFENDHDWWTAWEKNMDHEEIQTIKAVAKRVMHAKYDRKRLEMQGKSTDKVDKFIKKWEHKIRRHRSGQTYYMRGSAFTNLAVLGLDYMQNQLKGARSNEEKFNLSILGIRPQKVKNMFFPRFSKEKHIFQDGYSYSGIDTVTISGDFVKSSYDLKYCNRHKPIVAGFDPGIFMSIVFGQQKENTLRLIKNMYVIGKEQHEELARRINEFFKTQINKTLYLYYDRAGNQRKYNAEKGETDAQLLKTELGRMGWHVKLMSQGQRTIFHWEHYLLGQILFGEKEKKTPRIRIDQNECEELISSIYMSPVKKRPDGWIELDKSSEKRLDYEDQAYWSTQIATSMTYLLHGLYNKYLPSRYDTGDIEGL